MVGFALIFALVGLVAPAAAADSGSDGVHALGFRLLQDDSPAPVSEAKDAGTIDGQVVTVDYRAGTMAVQAGTRKLDVTVLPSTNIEGPGNAFHTIADIKKGAKVKVLLSQRGTTYTAQLITLH